MGKKPTKKNQEILKLYLQKQHDTQSGNSKDKERDSGAQTDKKLLLRRANK